MDFEPWGKYAELTRERLLDLAAIICKERRKVVDLHDAAAGDNKWSLGCRAYARVCHSLRNAARTREWLSVLPDKDKLRFTFVIGSIPIRFYHGDAADPPSKYLGLSDAEERQRQMIFDLGVPLDKILRIAYETKPPGYVSRIALIQMNEDGDVTDTFAIPITEGSVDGRIVPLQPKGIDLPPLTVEALEKDDEQDERKGRDAG